jgi:hypothetical protein
MARGGYDTTDLMPEPAGPNKPKKNRPVDSTYARAMVGIPREQL